jgi:2,3-bisphosphoglycerate-dependent phosphoglycerate mutase
MLKQLYLIRHAQPKQGTGIPYDRIPGPPLSDAGNEEAKAAGLYLSQCGMQVLYASPLDRTQETAKAIAEKTGLHVITEEAIAEHRNDETFDKVKARVRDFLARVESEPVEVAGFVTHGSPIKALLQILSDEKIVLSNFVFDAGNHAPWAGVWRAERRDNAWVLELVFTPAMVRAI